MLTGILEKYWGYSSFRPLQLEAMEAVMAGRDSLLVLPTGGGKSLCFQAPAIARDGLAIVVSPLISLMKDQVDTLVGNGVSAAYYNSSMPSEARAEVTRGIRDGRYRMLYVAPERLVGDGGDGFLKLLESKPVSFIAVDEAHCISQWGHDFRTEYRQLARLRERWPSVSMHAYTATATGRVRKDIIAQLGLRDAAELVGSFDRPNLVYRVLARAHAQGPDPRRARAPSRPGRHHLLHVAQGSGQPVAVAERHRLAVAAVSRRAGRRGTQPQPGRVPERRGRPGGGDRGLRHGHRSLGRALRDPLGRAAVARALPAGIGPRRP